MRLLVNVDHIATLRNARGEGYPDPTEAAKACEDAGAAGIVFHLRSDRRHIKDEDVHRLIHSIAGISDFEMAATDEMLEICSGVKPDVCTLVPEGREELTTEGGLNMASVADDFSERVFPLLRKTGCEISLFVDPNVQDIRLAAELGADAIELHTGVYANAQTKSNQVYELQRLYEAAALARESGLIVNAGHGLNLENFPALAKRIPFLRDVSIGHALISTAVFRGLRETVRAYLNIIASSQ